MAACGWMDLALGAQSVHDIAGAVYGVGEVTKRRNSDGHQDFLHYRHSKADDNVDWCCRATVINYVCSKVRASNA